LIGFDDYKVVLYRNQPDGWAASAISAGPGRLGRTSGSIQKEQLVGFVMIQTRNTRLREEYPNLVYQAFVD